MEWTQGDFTITDRRDDLDVDVLHNFLRESYWAERIPRALVEKSIRHSLCFGLYHGANQVGFGRVVSDQATFAYVADAFVVPAFVVPAFRGRGLGRWLVSCVLAHPQLQGLRRWLLATRDAHGLYRQHGFGALRRPEAFMEINDPYGYHPEPPRR